MFEQERFIGRLQRHVLGDSAVRSCYLSGSFGRRGEDAFSDVDIALVYANDDERERQWQGRESFIKDVMPYVPVRSFDATHVRRYLHIALYSNGTKADYRFESMESLRPNPWEREIRILKDTDSWAEQFQAESVRLALPRPYLSADELAAIDDRFWIMLWDVIRLLRRGDVEKPFPIYLQLMHFTLPPLLEALPPEDPAYQGLLKAAYSRDAQATLRGLGELLGAYLAARSAVVRRHNLAFMPNSAFESEIRRQVEKLTR